MKTWLKGGLIGLVVGVILFFIIRGTSCSLVYHPGPDAVGGMGLCNPTFMITVFIGSILIGILIGWFIGKSKSK